MFQKNALRCLDSTKGGHEKFNKSFLLICSTNLYEIPLSQSNLFTDFLVPLNRPIAVYILITTNVADYLDTVKRFTMYALFDTTKWVNALKLE
jgi:hypothetical protein